MTAASEDLFRQALSLDEKDRATLAGALIESLHGEIEPGTDEAWAAEIKRRVAELEANSVASVPWSQVKDRLFHGYE